MAKAGQRILSQFRRGLLARARQLTIGMELIQFLLHNRQYIRIPIGSKPLGVDCTRTDREGFNRVDESRVGRQVGRALDGRKEREDVINMIRLANGGDSGWGGGKEGYRDPGEQRRRVLGVQRRRRRRRVLGMPEEEEKEAGVGDAE